MRNKKRNEKKLQKKSSLFQLSVEKFSPTLSIVVVGIGQQKTKRGKKLSYVFGRAQFCGKKEICAANNAGKKGREISNLSLIIWFRGLFSQS